MIYCHKQSLLEQYPTLQPAEVLFDGDMGGMASDLARDPSLFNAASDRMVRKITQAAEHGGPVLIDLERTPVSTTNGLLDYVAAQGVIYPTLRSLFPSNKLCAYGVPGKVESRPQDIKDDRRADIETMDAYTKTATRGYDWLVPECYISKAGANAKHWIEALLDRTIAMAGGRPVVPIIWAVDWATGEPAAIEELAVILLGIKNAGIQDVWLWSHYQQNDADCERQHRLIIRSFG